MTVLSTFAVPPFLAVTATFAPVTSTPSSDTSPPLATTIPFHAAPPIFACVPSLFATSLPLTVIDVPEATFIDAPAAIVIVVPAGIATAPLSDLPSAHVSSAIAAGGFSPGGVVVSFGFGPVCAESPVSEEQAARSKREERKSD